MAKSIHSYKFIRTLWIFTVAVLLASVIIACGTSTPTNIPHATAFPSSTTLPVPESITATPEPVDSEGTGSILLPSPTPAPTPTPGAVAEIISEFTEAQGLENVTVLRVKVEDWLNLAYSLLLIIIFGFILSRLLLFIVEKIIIRTKNEYDENFFLRIRWQIYVIMITFGFQVGILRLDILEAITKIRIKQLYSLIYIISVTIILWKLVDALVSWYQNEVEPKRSDSNYTDTVLILLSRIARLLLVTISMIMVLSVYNINVTALITAIGVGGLAVSLAAQDTLSNVISGVMIMLDQPFRVGDRIEIPKMSTWGDVVDIGLRSTRIRTRDNRLVIVPNNTISTDQVINYSYPDSSYRIQIEIGVGYGQDIEKVRQVIVDTVRKVEGVLPDKPVDALYVSMGESAMIFRVRWWLESYRDTRLMFDRVNTILQKAFEEAGIALAVNTMDINIVNKPADADDKSVEKSANEDKAEDR
jgi:MscS family membrane protein